MFSNVAQQNAWTHTATYRSHTHDILCSAVAILKQNYTLIFNTQMKKQIRRQLTTSPSTAQSVKRDAVADEPTKKQKEESGAAVDVNKIGVAFVSAAVARTARWWRRAVSRARRT